MNLWPPFLFSGIRVREIADDFSHARVELQLRWYNRNYVNVHFGGSLFAMTDPFWMLLLMRHLGSDHRVWDKAAQIEFVKPGRGRVRTEFNLDPGLVESLRQQAADGRPVLHWFETQVLDEAGDVVARVRKQVYVRRKREHKAPDAA
jgi:acyl-coenzyme A thioesterase PaaI-like protein